MKFVPLTNSSKFAIVDDCYYRKIMKYKWLKVGDYVRTALSSSLQISLHIFLFGKAPKEIGVVLRE